MSVQRTILSLAAILVAGCLLAPQFGHSQDDLFGGSPANDERETDLFGSSEDDLFAPSDGNASDDDLFGSPEPDQMGDADGLFAAPAEEPAPESRARENSALREQPLSSSRINTPVFYAEPNALVNERIRKVLARPLYKSGLQFTDTPLSEVVAFIRDEYEIEVLLDLPALDDLAISPDEVVSVNLRHMSLGSALQHLLRPFDLTYMISDEVLLVTSDDEALTRPKVAIYPVGDILAAKPGYENNSEAEDKKRRSEDISALIDLIISTVASDTWVENGGPEAEIRAIQPGLLVISQTTDVHEQLTHLFDALRRAKQHEYSIPHVDLSYQQQLTAQRHYEASMQEYFRQLREHREATGDDSTNAPEAPQPPIPQGGGGFF
ncbi:hypothetical protein [Aeoliella mucimassa]|uniref:Uncharacterized protein n=1 Tax=Aeoliella mucimassa TaxID=2527972 RepID=A0A518AHJ8_9BACT|nr:hypothetical protein [Aeoliella mucimassa]QDU54208.1 hypothetical protein Pan181_03880 [Aeoliella mucimassa]